MLKPLHLAEIEGFGHLLDAAMESPARWKLIALLRAYGYDLAAPFSTEALRPTILEAIGSAGQAFGREISLILAGQVQPLQTESGFNVPEAMQGANLSVGADPVSAIAGAVSSIAGILGNGQRQKLLRQEARMATTNAILTGKQNTSATPVPPPTRPRRTGLWFAGVSLALLLGGFWIINTQK